MVLLHLAEMLIWIYLAGDLTVDGTFINNNTQFVDSNVNITPII